jgi:putative endonuclease
MFRFWKPKKSDKATLPEHLRTGEWGEEQAERFLKKKGCRILGRRVRVTPRDEIDLVVRDGDVLVFVEVKTRGKEDFGRPFTAVDRRKRHALSRAAVRYLKKIAQPRTCFRFDVIEVVGGIEGTKPVVRHIENAFLLDRCYLPPG